MKIEFYPEEWKEFIDNCDFTDQELKVIELIRRGWFVPDIAAELYISDSTVKRLRKKIANKILHYIAFRSNK